MNHFFKKIPGFVTLIRSFPRPFQTVNAYLPKFPLEPDFQLIEFSKSENGSLVEKEIFVKDIKTDLIPLHFVKDKEDLNALKVHLKDKKEFLVVQLNDDPLFREMMQKATNSYTKITSLNEFSLEDAKALDDQILFKEHHFFGQKIPGSLVSGNPLAERLQDASDPSHLPFPFVLSPARKALLEKLLPSPKTNHAIIEGFSQAGKSNFGCYLSLIYRMQKKKKVVMYIGNMNDFNQNPYEYVLNELFYWFYEEIAGDLTIQNYILQYIITPDGPKENMTTNHFQIKWLIKRLVQLSRSKSKRVFLIVDQFNLSKIDQKGAAHKILDHLMALAQTKIYITTNTDNKINPIKRPDGGSAKIFVLDEIENPIQDSELSKLIMKLFPTSKKDFQRGLISKLEGNLNLIFLFYNYCVKRNFLNFENDVKILEKCEDFCKEYIEENADKHRSWRTFSESTGGPKFLENLGKLMLLLNTDGPLPIDHRYLVDKRYLYEESNRLYSINSLIETMFKSMYWSSNLIEDFLNKYGVKIGGSPFGTIFEYYIFQKINERNMNLRPLVLKLKEGKFLTLDFKETKNVRFGGNQKNAKIAGIETDQQKQNKKSGYDVIQYDSISPMTNVFFETPQKTFPFFDRQITIFEAKNDQINISHSMISFKLDGKLITTNDYKDLFQRYCHSYGKQAKEQLGDGIQRVIYFCYRNKKTAEEWFEKNMKSLTVGVEVYFIEFKDIKKENPADFLLDDNINIRLE